MKCPQCEVELIHKERVGYGGGIPEFYEWDECPKCKKQFNHKRG